jgi:hypothetical protein
MRNQPTEESVKLNRHRERDVSESLEVQLYIFFREEGWYPVEIPPDHLLANVELNPGTLKVEDLEGNIVWRPQ